MEALIAKLKNEIIDVLNLTEMTPESINEDEPLFVDWIPLMHWNLLFCWKEITG
jgi:hypothetical protein